MGAAGEGGVALDNIVTVSVEAGWRSGPAGQLPGAQKRHWKNRKYGASKLRFPHAKEFLLKLSGVWDRALRNVRQPCSGPKKFKECRNEVTTNC